MTEYFKIIASVSTKSGKLYYKLIDMTDEPFVSDIYYPTDVKYLNDFNLIDSITKYVDETIDTGMDRQSLFEILNYHWEQKFNKKGNIIITTWIGL